MRNHLIGASIIWIVLTIIGEAWVMNTQFYPLARAKEAKIVDEAFTQLMVMGMPVFTFVLAFLGYSVVRFRHDGEPCEDGAAIYTSNLVTRGWLGVTSALALAVFITPGLTGLDELMHSKHGKPDFEVNVQGGRWYWVVSYPQGAESRKELVLPINKRIQFNITAVDVLHSFWIPAFRAKIDAVPGMTTTITFTPSQLGSFETDYNLRLQCAELCGGPHSLMVIPVRIVEQKDFEAWLTQNRKQ
jgi:cytochrome c oxidase subunit 2